MQSPAMYIIIYIVAEVEDGLSAVVFLENRFVVSVKIDR